MKNDPTSSPPLDLPSPLVDLSLEGDEMRVDGSGYEMRS